MNPRYSILMLTHNRLGAFQSCLASLLSTLARPDVEWLILDNGSDQPTRSFVQALPTQFPDHRLRLILSDSNLGVAAGRAKLLGHAHGEILIFLDSDVLITDLNWLSYLSEPLAQPQVGLCGVGGGYVLPDWSGFTLGPIGECDIVSGYCQAFKREVILAGARLDLRYGRFWCEDSAFCLTIRALGWSIWNCGFGVGVQHAPGRSGDEPGLLERNMELFRSQYMGKGLVKSEGAY